MGWATLGTCVRRRPTRKAATNRPPPCARPKRKRSSNVRSGNCSKADSPLVEYADGQGFEPKDPFGSPRTGESDVVGVTVRLCCLGCCLAGVVLPGRATAAEVRPSGKAAAASSRLIEVRQGGYVEKVDPAVDYKDRLPWIPPREPTGSLRTFHLIAGLRIEPVACEPMIADPVDMVFDENGRLYVAELITYAEREVLGEVRNSSRVSLLEDTDDDGRFDRATVFADGLSWPTGLVCFGGGLFVASSPDILYLKDMDGDGRADVREVFITGFNNSSSSACPNSLRWGLDNRIHGMTSISGGRLRAVKWEASEAGHKADPVESRGRDFSFHPRTGQLRLESGGAQFGMSFDVWGRKFESSNSVPIEMVMYEDRYIARNPCLIPPPSRLRIHADGNAVYRTSPVEPWRILRTELRVKGLFSGPIEGGGTPAGYFTGACGVYVYTGNALPEAFRGNAFVGEGSGNLVHRMRLEPDGVALRARRVEQKHEFLTSDEIWFRPIQFADGPDGALYVADMYRAVYEHPDAVPPSARKHLDLLAGHDRGRIYRIVPEDFRRPGPVRLGELPTVELVRLLEHPNGWHRITASRLLYERHERKAIEPLKRLAAESPSPVARMHALYVLDGLDALTPESLLPRLDDPHPRVREHAVRLAERLLERSPPVRDKLYAMAADPDIRVRYQLAFTLGEISSSKATEALAAIARRDAADRWVRLAVLSSCYGRAGDLLSRLAQDPNLRRTATGRSLLEQLAEQTGLQDQGDQVAVVLRLLDRLAAEDKPAAQAILHGLNKGLAKTAGPLLARLNAGDGSRAQELLAEMLHRSKQQAADEDLAVPKRVAAVRSLALAPFPEVRHILGQLLDSRQPQEVQTAAIQALSRFAEAEVAEMLVDAWLGFTPGVRSEAAEALFARPERLAVLLRAIDEQVILPSQLDPARLQYLRGHRDPQIRQEAERLLASAALAPRHEIVEAWRDVLDLKGNPKNGREVFRRECSKCHLLEGVGVEIGLPLETIGNRGPEAILLAVLDPNREVNPAYLNYIIVTTDGLSMTGMIASETATSVTLKRAEGETNTVLRTEIEELVNTGMSIMPEGQEKLMTKQEMADLIAYLMSLE
ncbi:MAG TPA: c-type cytochrome [Planctomycetaceae bacterium]|nr:c-type cytochrome [Planctomycetaceae bacterium]